LQEFQKENAETLAKYEVLIGEIRDKPIGSFEDLKKFDKKKSLKALVKLSLQSEPVGMKGTHFELFGITSIGKSTIINK
jgi:hypothetical protein